MKDNFILTPAQRALVLSQAKYRHVIGGIGSGKTTGIMYLVVMVAQMFNNNCILIGRHHFGSLRDCQLPALQDILETLGIAYKLRRADMQIELSNGTKILFRPITKEQYPRLRSLALGMLVIEELDEIPQSLFEAMQKRLLYIPVLELDDNADPDLAMIFSRSWKRFSVTSGHGLPPQWIRDLWQHPTDPNYEAIHFDIGDNRHNLPKDYYEDLGLSDELKTKFLAGSWGGK